MTFESRAGQKLDYAIKTFKIDVRNLVVADFGSSTGGFVDCLLQNGAKKVYAVETGYGQLAWKLRNDKRVETLERTNAMHVMLPEKVDLISIDTSWTKQEKILPNAINNLSRNGTIITLIKPQYEFKTTKDNLSIEQVSSYIQDIAKENNLELKGIVQSPITGKRLGNKEYLAHLKILY